jgi:hypothetical protein
MSFEDKKKEKINFAVHLTHTSGEGGDAIAFPPQSIATFPEVQAFLCSTQHAMTSVVRSVLSKALTPATK